MTTRILLADPLAAIMRFLDSDTRASICSVSHQFATIALQVSISLSVYPQGYTQKPLPPGYLIGGCYETQKRVQNACELHLLYRLRPSRICRKSITGDKSIQKLTQSPKKEILSLLNTLRNNQLEIAWDLALSCKEKLSADYLAAACKTGDLALVRHIGTLCDARFVGDNIIKYACRSNNLDMVHYIVDKHHLYMREHADLIFWAHYYNNSSIIEYAQRISKSLTPREFLDYGLIGAVSSNNLALAQKLINKGANNHSFAAYKSCMYNASYGIKMMLELLCKSPHPYMQTYLLMACNDGHTETIKLIIQYGGIPTNHFFCIITAKYKNVEANIDAMMTPSIDVELGIRNAVITGNLRGIKHLLKYHTNQHINFVPILMVACKEEYYEICDFIMSHAWNGDPTIPITAAISTNDADCLIYLINNKYASRTHILMEGAKGNIIGLAAYIEKTMSALVS